MARSGRREPASKTRTDEPLARGGLVVLSRFFVPAVGLMNRLTYPRKFVLISVLFAVPLALVTGFLFGEINDSLDIARRQTLGLRYLRGIQPLFRAVLGQMQATASGPAADQGEARREASLAEIKQGLLALVRVDDQLGARFGTAERFDAVARHAEILRIELERPGAVVSDELREPLLAALRSLMVRVGDASRLILDEQLVSYYLVDTVLFNLPSGQILLAQIRSRGEVVASLQSLSNEERTKLSVLDGRLQNTWGAISVETKRAIEMDPTGELKLAVEEPLKAASVAMQEFENVIERELMNTTEITITAAALRQAGVRAMGTGFTLWDAAAPQLDRVLHERIDRYWR